MKKSIARALRRLADRFDPAGQRTSVTNITVNKCRATEDGTGRDIAAAQRRLNDAYAAQMSAAAKAGGEEFSRRMQEIARAPLGQPWMTKIIDGLAGASPALPNAAGAPAVKAPWWRRLLRRFGR